jgi:hypothetical protein
MFSDVVKIELPPVVKGVFTKEVHVSFVPFTDEVSVDVSFAKVDGASLLTGKFVPFVEAGEDKKSWGRNACPELDVLVWQLWDNDLDAVIADAVKAKTQELLDAKKTELVLKIAAAQAEVTHAQQVADYWKGQLADCTDALAEVTATYKV